jgi:glycosyltransferase involved in cell wall biosynthesis
MSTPVRLLAVHHGGGIGGAPVSLLKLLAALNPGEFAAEAIFTEQGEIATYARELGARASIVPTGGAFFYSAHARLDARSMATFIRTFPGAVRRAQATLRTQRPDVLHLNTSVLLAWAAAARREGVPVVWMVREVLGPNPTLRRWHARFILSRSERVVAVSDFVRDYLVRSAGAEDGTGPTDSPGQRCDVGVPSQSSGARSQSSSGPGESCRSGARGRVLRVYNAVDLNEFRLELLETAVETRRALGLENRTQTGVVMAVGAVQRPKGHWLLLDALVRMPRPSDLVLVTGGADRAYARSARGRLKRALDLPLDNLDALLRDARKLGLSERIHVTGFRRDVSRLIAAADVLAFLSLEPEGFGRPIIEAMALARPVVATDVGPSAELLGPDAGRLVRPEPAGLAEVLRELLEAPDERERMGRAGRARVEQLFTLARQVAEMSAIYRSVAGAV